MLEKHNNEPIQPIMVKDYLPTTEIDEDGNEITDLTPTQNKTFTLDVTSQTLQMLAEAVAKKISDDITNSDMAKKVVFQKFYQV